jgi:hypothetical protein
MGSGIGFTIVLRAAAGPNFREAEEVRRQRSKTGREHQLQAAWIGKGAKVAARAKERLAVAAGGFVHCERNHLMSGRESLGFQSRRSNVS